MSFSPACDEFFFPDAAERVSCLALVSRVANSRVAKTMAASAIKPVIRQVKGLVRTTCVCKTSSPAMGTECLCAFFATERSSCGERRMRSVAHRREAP
jgi:hypothetical protein